MVHTKGDKKKSEVQKVRIWGGIVYAIYMYRGDLENTHMILVLNDKDDMKQRVCSRAVHRYKSFNF